MDVTRIIGRIRALSHQGKPTDVDSMRKEFIDMKVNEFKVERESAGRQWRRALEKALEDGKIVKSGRNLVMAEKKSDPWD